MASLSRDKSGNFSVQFVAADKRRRTVRLGKLSKKLAESVKLKVEALNAANISRLPLDGETAAWVAGIGDDLARKLAAVGLIPDRTSQTLAAFLAEYVAGRQTDGHTKPATLVTLRRVAADLKAAFGADADLRTVTPKDADRFRRQYQAKEHAPATTYRRLAMCRMLFAHAVRLKLIPDNPFAEVRGKNGNPAARQRYVSPADADRLITAANPTWRIIVALCRYGGLRCPSEVVTLKWEHIDFATGRMTVTSPKTEHLDGKAYRVVPIFAELRPHLDDAFELAEPGEAFVVGGPQGATYRAAAHGPNGWVNANLRSTFLRLIRRAGLQPWPRVFQNLRASCETDLMQRHPIHVVTAWIGNTPKVALQHYLQTLEADFAKAVEGATKGAAKCGADALQNAVQSPADPDGLIKTLTGVEAGNEGELSAPVRAGRVQAERSGSPGRTRTDTPAV